MNHRQRVEQYEKYMAAQGVGKRSAAPPLWQWMWSLGIECPPPPFMNAVALGLFLGAALSVIPPVLWAYSYFRHPLWHHLGTRELWWFMLGCFAFGALVGPFYYRRMARRHGLRSWSSFRGVRQLL